MQDIHISLVDALDGPLARVHSYGTDSEDTSQLYTVTGLAKVDKLIVDADGDGMGRLASGDAIRSLLKLDDLFVFKRAPVVDDLHRVFGSAQGARALGRLPNLASVQANVDGVVADVAAEEGILHVGNHGRCADNEALDGHKAVHV
jgi:hypothetical protein